MDKLINTIGLAIVAAKYTSVLLLAGLTLSTGVMAAEAFVLLGTESTE
jgi:hypothetical protein